MPVPSPLLSVADGKMTGSAGWDMCESGDASQRRRSEDDAGGNSTEEHRSRQPPPAFVDCFCDYDSLVLFLGGAIGEGGQRDVAGFEDGSAASERRTEPRAPAGEWDAPLLASRSK
eukprot:CAMPEP_0194333536 /NCGR_PEP_ID=MMETSP0171-20130528/63032_1 /TAXON_ID=218684 /ORGANISM="Corethron pennatum, Strain L29A3" /LENGTH=115 /DNA_ID=CAMNT_0039095809 /DNA_START=157 /DNA_END=503 /DNA_ORIENTATION=+